MKNTLCLILTALFIALAFTSSSLARDRLGEEVEDLRKDIKDLLNSEKTRKIRQPVIIEDIKFSPDGTRLAVAGHSGVFLYDVQMSGKNVQKGDKPVKLTGHVGRGWKVAFNPDGKILASLNGLGALYLLDVNTGQRLRTIKGDSETLGTCVAFSPDSRTIATGSGSWWDGTVHLWDAHTGKLLRTLIEHAYQVLSVAFSPDGGTIATGGSREDSIVRLWDTRTGKLLRTLTGHVYQVLSVAFSPDGTLLASGGLDKPVRLWDVKTGQQIRTLVEGDPGFSISPGDPGGGRGPMGSVHSVAFSPDGKTLASSNLLCIRLWDVNTGKLLRKLRERSGGHGNSVVVFSPDGKTLAVCGSDEIDLWDVKTGRQIRRLIIPF